MRIGRGLAAALCLVLFAGCGTVGERAGDARPGSGVAPVASGSAEEDAPDLGDLDLGGVDPAAVVVTDDDEGLEYRDVGTEPGPEGVAAARDAIIAGRLLEVDEPGSGLQVLHDVALASRLGSVAPERRPVVAERFGDTGLAPGVGVDLPGDGDDPVTCTLGFLGTRAGSPVALTAGHCTEGSAGRVEWRTGEGAPASPVGDVVAAQNRGRGLDDGMEGVTDFALATVGPDVPLDRRIVGRYTVSRILRPDELRPGMELCSIGFRTEETCGQVIASNATMVRAAVYSLGGDSGSPAYVRLDDTHVAAVGILSGSPVVDGELSDDVTDFALLAPILRHTGVAVPG